MFWACEDRLNCRLSASASSAPNARADQLMWGRTGVSAAGNGEGDSEGGADASLRVISFLFLFLTRRTPGERLCPSPGTHWRMIVGSRFPAPRKFGNHHETRVAWYPRSPRLL
jgi:hypothetical protein